MASCLSPCFIPLAPAYFALLTHARTRAGRVLSVTLFVLGFAAVFVALGYGASAIGRWMSLHLPMFRYFGGLVVVVMGLQVLGLLKWRPLLRDRSIPFDHKTLRPASAFFFGAIFAASWTACTGPILASVLILASTQARAVAGITLLGAYALGLVVPLLLLLAAWTLVPKLRMPPLVPRIAQYAAGILMVGLGVLMMTGRLAVLSGI